ncbi:MAG: EexN family lipoprotein [Sphingomonas sp.]
MAVITICCTVGIAACGRSPRSEDYFLAHLDDAREVVARCHARTKRGEECGNADYAIRLTRAEARRDRLFALEP